jgi:hypothetical protein
VIVCAGVGGSAGTVETVGCEIGIDRAGLTVGWGRGSIVASVASAVSAAAVVVVVVAEYAIVYCRKSHSGEEAEGGCDGKRDR